MAQAHHPSHFQNRRAPGGSGFEVARLFGIPVLLDKSLIIAAALVIFTVALGPFGALHEDWSAATRWTVAFLAAAGLFASIYLHELGHALVAARFGLRTERITLFVLGGMAQMASEPKSAKSEFWIAVAGPAVSFLLGTVLLTLAFFGAADAAGRDAMVGEPEQFLRSLNPLASLAIWLGNVNIVLGLFNLIPAFPLDGGRVLRAAVWTATGDSLKSTRWASAGGRWLGWTLIMAGTAMFLGIHVPLFGSGIGGLWLALIGWFVVRAASASVEQALLSRRLDGVSVSALMQRHFGSARWWMSIREVVDEVATPRNQVHVPVAGPGGEMIGLITPDCLKGTAKEDWQRTPVTSLMTPLDKLVVAYASDLSMEALQAVAHGESDVLPVLDRDGRCVGLFNRAHVLSGAMD